MKNVSRALNLIRRFTLAASLPLFALAAGCLENQDASKETAPIAPSALAVSAPVPVNQVEDAAIWVAPGDSQNALLLISNKHRGLELHRPDGLLLKYYADQTELAGVDVLYGFGADHKRDLVIAAAVGGPDPAAKPGVRIWEINPEKLRLTELTTPAALPVMPDDEPLGVAACHSRKNGKCYFFISSGTGAIEQYELTEAADGQLHAAKVRALKRPGKVKGMVVDEEAGLLFFAEEKVGVFQTSAEPDAGDAATQILKMNDGHLTPDLTGMTLYFAQNGAGCLIIVCQNPRGDASTFALFDRQAPHTFRGIIAPARGKYSTPHGASGIAVSNRPAGPMFPAGFLAIKDRLNPDGVEDYKIFSWQDIASSGRLPADTTWSPRGN